MRLVPGLAEKIDVSADGRAFTIAIRPDAVWEDGTPVGAGDAVFTIRKIADPNVASPLYKALFEDLVSVEELDPKTFRAAFREPYAYREMAFALPLLPARRFEGVVFEKAGQNRSPLSNGPYRLQSWKAQESIVLERNPRYAGPAGSFRADPLPDPAGQCRRVSRAAAGRAGRKLDGRLAQGARGRRPGVRRVLPPRRVLRPRLQLHRLERAAAVFRGRAGAASRHDASRPRRDRPSPLPGVRARDLRALGARISRLRRVGEPLPFDPRKRRCSWTRPDGGTRTATEFGTGAGASSISICSSRPATRSGSRSTRSSRRRSPPRESGAHPPDRVGELRRAARRRGVRSGVARVERVGPQSGPLSLLGLVAMAAAGLQQRVLSESRGRPSHAGRAASWTRSPRIALFHRLHRIFRDDAPAVFVVNATKQYGLARRVEGVETSPLGLFGIWPGPMDWLQAPGGGAAGRRPDDRIHRPPPPARGPDSLRDRRARVPPAASGARQPGARWARIRAPCIGPGRRGDAPAVRPRPPAPRTVRRGSAVWRGWTSGSPSWTVARSPRGSGTRCRTRSC